MTILLITNRLDYTADFVVLELRRRTLDYIRLNTEDIPSQVKVCWSLEAQADSYLDVAGRRVILGSISSIWYRRPVAPVPSAEITDTVARSFVVEESRTAFAGIWRTIDCLWVSHPDSLYAASFKIVQLNLAKRLGFTLPQTLITNIPNEACSFLSTLEADAVYKPISMSRLEYPNGNKLIFTSRLNPDHVESLDRVRYAPSQFQRMIKKEADIRVTVIGDKVFAVAIDSQSFPESQVDWRRGNTLNLSHRVIHLPVEIESRCLRLVSTLGLKFGAIDLILTPESEYYFLEINGNGQWAWIEQLTGLPLTAAMVDLLSSR